MSNQNTGKEKFSKFIRYSDGARMYHMSQSKFMQLAKVLFVRLDDAFNVTLNEAVSV